MPSKKLKTPLQSDCYYHIYNRGNNHERIFFSDADYQFFLRRYENLVVPFTKTYAYCLLPNHFHFLIKTRPEVGNTPSVVSNQLRKLFICYSRRINDRGFRSGSLFTKNFQRIEIDSESYFKSVVRYIHQNPRKHGLSVPFQNYGFSSFRYYQQGAHPWLKTEEAIDWFGGQAELLEFHLSESEMDDVQEKYLLESDGVPKKSDGVPQK